MRTTLENTVSTVRSAEPALRSAVTAVWEDNCWPDDTEPTLYDRRTGQLAQRAVASEQGRITQHRQTHSRRMGAICDFGIASRAGFE
jgi:hypothetical protein